jgi:hypothetical protein
MTVSPPATADGEDPAGCRGPAHGVGAVGRGRAGPRQVPQPPVQGHVAERHEQGDVGAQEDAERRLDEESGRRQSQRGGRRPPLPQQGQQEAGVERQGARRRQGGRP